MEVTGSRVILAPQMEAEAREGKGPGHHHAAVPTELRGGWAPAGSQSHILPSPVPPIRLWSGRAENNERSVRITDYALYRIPENNITVYTNWN